MRGGAADDAGRVEACTPASYCALALLSFREDLFPAARGIEVVSIGQLAIRFLLEGEASGGSVAVFEFDIPAAARVPIAHSHDGYEETIYGLEGVLTWTVDGERTDVGPGEVLCIPRGVVHRFDNDHEVDAKMLAIISPGILSFDYFREMAAVIKGATDGPPDPAALAEVMGRHGLTPAP